MQGRSNADQTLSSRLHGCDTYVTGLSWTRKLRFNPAIWAAERVAGQTVSVAESPLSVGLLIGKASLRAAEDSTFRPVFGHAPIESIEFRLVERTASEIAAAPGYVTQERSRGETFGVVETLTTTVKKRR